MNAERVIRALSMLDSLNGMSRAAMTALADNDPDGLMIGCIAAGLVDYEHDCVLRVTPKGRELLEAAHASR